MHKRLGGVTWISVRVLAFFFLLSSRRKSEESNQLCASKVIERDPFFFLTRDITSPLRERAFVSILDMNLIPLQ